MYAYLKLYRAHLIGYHLSINVDLSELTYSLHFVKSKPWLKTVNSIKHFLVLLYSQSLFPPFDQFQIFILPVRMILLVRLPNILICCNLHPFQSCSPDAIFCWNIRIHRHTTYHSVAHTQSIYSVKFPTNEREKECARLPHLSES